MVQRDRAGRLKVTVEASRDPVASCRCAPATHTVMSKERAKLFYRWKAAVKERWATSMGRLVRD